MKKSFIATMFIVVSLFVGGTVFAQGQQVTIPLAGLTPDSPFYFLDRLGENLRQFFTFNPGAKAKLQIEFAGERIAEIKVMVEKKGDETKGIDKAKALLLGNVAYAAEIVNQEKASGKDVARLAKDIDEQFDSRDALLVQTFLNAREKLAAQHKEIKDKLLKDAQAAGDTAKVAELTQQMNDIQNQADGLIDKKDEIKKAFRDEQQNIEENMNQEDQQQDEKDQNQQDQIEQNQEGEQGELELNQTGEQGESKLEQSGEQGKTETNLKGDQGKTEINQSGNQGKQESDGTGTQGISNQDGE